MAARDQDRVSETEAHAYVAFDLVARGQVNEALVHLQWVLQSGTPNVTEYYIAVALHKHLTGSRSKWVTEGPPKFTGERGASLIGLPHRGSRAWEG